MKNFLKSIRSNLDIIFLVLVLYWFVVQIFIVPSLSMYPTLKPGDIIVAKKYAYGLAIPEVPVIHTKLLPDLNDTGRVISWSTPKKGEVVVFVAPMKKYKTFVKRVVATPGDEIILRPREMWISPAGEVPGFFRQAKTRTFLGKVWYVNPYSSFGANYDISDIPKENLTDYESIKKSGKFKIEKSSEIGEFLFLKNDGYFMSGDNRNLSFDSRFFGPIPFSKIIGPIF